MTAIVFARRTLLRGAGLALLAVPFRTSAEAASGPIAPVQQLDQALLTIMQQGKGTPFARRAAELTPALEAALDLPAILRVSVGPGWASLKPEDQKRLLDAFRQYTVATFVQNFDSYNGQKITVSPQTRSLSGGAQVVSTRIVPRSGGEGHTIDYVMRKTPGGAWKATDVLADGTISRVAVMRSDFAGMLAQGGASALVASLQQKTAALERG